KYGVGLIEMRSSSDGLINGPLAGGNLSSFQPELLYGIQSGRAKNPALNDIELAAAAGLLGVYIISLSGCGQCASFMKKGSPEFCRDRVSGAAISQGCTGCGML